MEEEEDAATEEKTEKLLTIGRCDDNIPKNKYLEIVSVASILRYFAVKNAFWWFFLWWFRLKKNFFIFTALH